MQQVVVGLLAAMLSYGVYSINEAYIEDDDDVVAVVAQAQVVFTYFAALAIYTSDVADQKRDTFSSTAFGVVLILIFLSSCIVAVWVILLDVFGYSRFRDFCNDVLTRCWWCTRRQQKFSTESPSSPADKGTPRRLLLELRRL